MMFRKFSGKLLSIICCLLLCYFIPVSELDSNTEVQDSLQRLEGHINTLLRSSALKNASVGIQIMSLNSGEIVYEHNPELSLNPASNTKLITSAVALVKLTPQYQFQTRVYRTARIQDGVLTGDLYLKGGGDPSLSYQDLLSLAQEVSQAGIQKISGNIVGDDSFFDDEREFSGWHDFSRAYSGKISALSLNYNAAHLMMKPAYRSGVAPQIFLDPPISYLQVKNNAVTLAAKNSVYASFLAPDNERTQETLLVEGKISPKTKYGISAYIYVNNPALFTTSAFKDALEQFNITVEGEVMLGKVPGKSHRIASHVSEQLSAIICASNKSSNNFVAEQLLKTVGAEVLGAPGSTASGLQVIQQFLNELDIPPEAYVLENGSGLSRNNRLSPEQIVTLLTYMYHNFEVRSEYLASLAVAGVDGTLRSRLQDTQAERRMRAKTGAINRVSCLSGYAASKDNDVLAFSIMMNGYTSGGYAVKKIQNEIGLALTEFYQPTYNALQQPTDSTP